MRIPIRIIIGVTLLGTCESRAQQVVDGSAKNVDEAAITALHNAAIEELTDPLSSQMIELRYQDEKQQFICGRINTKNLQGGYVGFKPFRVVLRNIYNESSMNVGHECRD